MATEIGYGHFHGGDPRKFSPDPECSTDEEREKHRIACAAWDRGERPEIKSGCEWLSSEVKVIWSGFGLGTYEFELDDEEGDVGP